MPLPGARARAAVAATLLLAAALLLLVAPSTTRLPAVLPTAPPSARLPTPRVEGPGRLTAPTGVAGPPSAATIRGIVAGGAGPSAGAAGLAAALAFADAAAASDSVSHFTTVAFADQMSNVAGPLFATSLLPYLAFLTFLGHKGNRVPPLALFGFRFLLCFVAATIASSIVGKVVYGVTLANSDWLHGSSEALLCITNLLVVLGLRAEFRPQGTATAADSPGTALKVAAAAYAAGAAASFFLLSGAVGVAGLPVVDAHAAFLGGLGNLPADVVAGLGLAHAEPANALSIPTWFIHFSSVIEYLVAMHLVWGMAALRQNERWKGLTWGMMPLVGSGLVACSYHFFYNSADISFMVALQAGLTFLGNTTCAVAAYRLAASNGWTWRDLNPFAKCRPAAVLEPLAPEPTAAAAAPAAAAALPPLAQDAAKLVGVSVLGSYLIKYGSLQLDLPFQATPVAAVAFAGLPLLLVAGHYWNRSSSGGSPGDSQAAPSLTMADIKKFGIAGTVSYILTEVLFWVLALPGAAILLHETQGHWPDLSSNVDRAALLGFVFAGANIARAALPLRLGAALALAPWVDRNLINRGQQP